jgi:NAD(P)-dependent dehydrogenase (short-subunit alcohol dehydrogenase family)
MKSPRSVALVTGAAGGIGRAVIRALAKTHRVVATDLAPPRAARSIDRTFALDVSREEQIRAVRNTLQAQYRRLDVLVHCAAVALPGSTLYGKPANWERTLEVNVLGAVRCIRAFGELMARRGGWIILLGSQAARHPLPGAGAYAASKAALESLTRTAAVELAPLRVGVIALSPGWVDTPLLRGRVSRDGFKSGFNSLTRAEEIAEVVAALAALRTHCLTGTCISSSPARGAE